MNASAAKKKNPPTTQDAEQTIELPFTQADGFLTDEEISDVHPDDTLRFRNETTGSGSITVYILAEDGQATTSALLGSSNQSFSVGNGNNVEKVVLTTGKYLLSKTAPPVNPNDPSGGSIITIIITS